MEAKTKKPPSDKIKEFNAEIITFSIGGKKVGSQLRDVGERCGIIISPPSSFSISSLPPYFPNDPLFLLHLCQEAKSTPKLVNCEEEVFVSTIKEQTEFRFQMCSIFTKIRWGLSLNSTNASFLLV